MSADKVQGVVITTRCKLFISLSVLSINLQSITFNIDLSQEIKRERDREKKSDHSVEGI